jgi:hypothetical protein
MLNTFTFMSYLGYVMLHGELWGLNSIAFGGKMRVNRPQKEVIVACFRVLPWRLIGEIKDVYANPNFSGQ